MERTLPLMEVRDHLGTHVDAAHFSGDVTIMTKNGKERAVIVSHDWYLKARAAIGEKPN